MLRPRIIPSLLVKDKGLVKTVKFTNPKYVGDPINAVKIFNEKEVDELAIFDIDATTKGAEPDYRTIADWAAECRMPLCYGGGIRSIVQARRIIGLGVEKVALSSAAIENPNLIGEIAAEIGCQSVVVVLDVKHSLFGGAYHLCTHNGQKNTGVAALEFAQQAEKMGAGELIINSIDNDGTMKGYDMALAERIRQVTSIPLTILGGAGSLDDIGELIHRFGIIGAAAGSLFVFKGKYRAVLINYPDQKEKEQLIEEFMDAAASNTKS
jgi:imidazole glycerol-phosphate synthase subunit HisF